jgi:hypothetical protein
MTAEEYMQFPSVDIDGTVYHCHTSALLKHKLSKLEQLYSPEVMMYAAFCQPLGHQYDLLHDVLGDRFAVLAFTLARN